MAKLKIPGCTDMAIKAIQRLFNLQTKKQSSKQNSEIKQPR